MGFAKPRVDIAIYISNEPQTQETIYAIIETKRPGVKALGCDPGGRGFDKIVGTQRLERNWTSHRDARRANIRKMFVNNFEQRNEEMLARRVEGRSPE